MLRCIIKRALPPTVTAIKKFWHSLAMRRGVPCDLAHDVISKQKLLLQVLFHKIVKRF